MNFESGSKEFISCLEKIGDMPLPPYITKKRGPKKADFRNYQTPFAEIYGSVAAPTASLHFSDDYITSLKRRKIPYCFITLHVGIGTFNPVRSENINDHNMHPEYGEINKETADMVTRTLKTGGRVIPVGTTSLRILESLDYKNKIVKPFSGSTDIFINFT